jgi:hypothetical protein
MTAAHAGRRALAARGTDGQAGVDTVNQVSCRFSPHPCSFDFLHILTLSQVVVRATKRVRIVMDKVEPT